MYICKNRGQKVAPTVAVMPFCPTGTLDNLNYKNMNNTVIIFAIVIVIAIALLAYRHFHHHDMHENVDKLRTVIGQIFKEAGKEELPRRDFLQAMKSHFGVNEKVVLMLVGRAKQENIIKVVDGIVKLL